MDTLALVKENGAKSDWLQVDVACFSYPPANLSKNPTGITGFVEVFYLMAQPCSTCDSEHHALCKLACRGVETNSFL